MGDTVTIPLPKPIKHGDAEYSAITMREATVGDQLDVTKEGMTAGEIEVAIIAKVSGVPVEVIRKIPLSAYRPVQATLANFPSSPAKGSGDTSSGSAGQPA
ncbi:MAG: phage tail assembly protein [Rhodospirillaceae bacterium]